ncbi:MAG: acetyl-CoA acetyltransferase [Sphingomonadaceae bacterium]|nr:acetyl-CoA acetyltransferase [Sphingomonadaceae bacterium]
MLVGAAQWVDRDSAPGEGLSPQRMLATVARAAIADSGAPYDADVVGAIDAVAVVRLFQDSGFPAPFGRQRNLPDALARRIGARPRRLLYGPVGGNSPQMLVNLLMDDIAAGRHDVALIAGCEAIRTQSRAEKAGIELDWSEDSPSDPETLGPETRLVSRHEMAHGIALPVNVYPLFENALAHHYGRDPVAHRQAIGRLMARFTAVAARNPFAQLPVERSAEELITPTDENRYIGYPYTKYLNSNMFVDQAAALLLMSVATADRLGVPLDRRVFLHGSADTHDHILVSSRIDYHSSPAIRIGAAHALAEAGVNVAQLTHIDLYSCFPSAVEIAADAIGLDHDDPRGLTLTGGLPYSGGPGNNYSLHAIAEVAWRCRAQPGSFGFVFANGGYLTKHSFGVWSTTPRPFTRTDPATYQREIDAMPAPTLDERPEGPGRIETFTVVHDRGRPAFAIVIGRLDANGHRFLAQIHDSPEALIDTPAIGRPVTVRPTDTVNLARLA